MISSVNQLTIPCTLLYQKIIMLSKIPAILHNCLDTEMVYRILLFIFHYYLVCVVIDIIFIGIGSHAIRIKDLLSHIYKKLLLQIVHIFIKLKSFSCETA